MMKGNVIEHVEKDSQTFLILHRGDKDYLKQKLKETDEHIAELEEELRMRKTVKKDLENRLKEVV